MGVNTDEMRAAGLAWQAAPQGSEEELDFGVRLLELADAAADEIDELWRSLRRTREEMRDLQHRLDAAGLR